MAPNLGTWFRDARRRRFADAYSRANGDTYSVHGLSVTIPASTDANVRYLLAKGRPYEAEEAHYVEETLQIGNTVIELGGSLGVISSVIRRAIGPDAIHIVAEANPDLAPICANNAAQGAAPGSLKVYQAAIAYTDSPTIAFDRGDRAHTGQIAQKGQKDTFQAPVKRLSDLVSELPDQPYALVCDIEGGEFPMFMEEPIETFSRLSHAIIEIHPKVFRAMGSSEAQFLEAIRQKGLTEIDRKADVLLLKGPAA